MKRHYVACMVARDASWVKQAERAGTLDGFHGYPKQSPDGVRQKEVDAYEAGYAQGQENRP